MNFKRIAALFCAAAMIMSSAVYAKSNKETAADDSVQILLSLGILKSESKPELQKQVTRGEFASLMADLFGVDTKTGHTNPDFIDVSKDHTYYGDICWLLDRNAVADGKLFEPDRGIMITEAAKITVSLLGYDLLAQSYGGYPSGYMYVARDKEVFKKILPEDTVLTYEDVYKMMVSMLECEPYVEKGFKADEEYERTLMYHNFSARKIEGIVTSDGVTAIHGSSVCRDGHITINGESFEETESFVHGDYIGCNVEAYVYNENDTDKICYILPTDNEITEITADDIVRA